jgi:hypothetical protein
MKVLIGKGLFTKCYLNDDGKTVTLNSICPIKEIMSLGWFPEHRLFPKIKRIDTNQYVMDYYPKVSSLKTTLSEYDYKLYKTLKHLKNAMIPNRKGNTLSDWTMDMFRRIPDSFSEEREVLEKALDACSNYGKDICFEISPRNVAVKDGRLILLDVFFADSLVAAVKVKKKGYK